MKKVKSIKLSWSEVANIISEQISLITGRYIVCTARGDNSGYWTVFIDGEHMPLSELFKIFEVVGADELQREDSLPESVMTEGSVKTIGMEVAELLLQRRLGYKWEQKIIGNDNLWLIGLKDKYFNEVRSNEKAEKAVGNMNEEIEGEDMEKNGLPQIYYLLLQGNVCCHDNDEFIGIYTNLEKLKVAYYEAKKRLEREQKNGFNSYCVLSIYKFDESAYGKDEGIVIVESKKLWE